VIAAFRHNSQESPIHDHWILQPEDPWEITGYVHNVVFTCGAVLEPNGTVKIYWGGADTVMCMGEANVSELVALCLDNGRPAKSLNILFVSTAHHVIALAGASRSASKHMNKFDGQ
jgi:glycosyl hydrolase family 130 (putative beta-1,4-mannooligosaccharide phosphorylase)